MYYYLKGKLALASPSLAVVDCGGVGYKCAITGTTYSQICRETEVKLYTYLNVREDAMDLFGFATEEEKDFFIMLLSVSGVGPKAALSVLSELSPSALATAILSSDVRKITAAQGVGPKMAQRICLELKDKIAKSGFESAAETPSQGFDFAGVRDEAIAVLTELGYSKSDADAAVRKCSAENTEDLVRQALRYLSRLI